jgi:hypothetical protein
MSQRLLTTMARILLPDGLRLAKRKQSVALSIVWSAILTSALIIGGLLVVLVVRSFGDRSHLPQASQDPLRSSQLGAGNVLLPPDSRYSAFSTATILKPEVSIMSPDGRSIRKTLTVIEESMVSSSKGLGTLEIIQ